MFWIGEGQRILLKNNKNRFKKLIKKSLKKIK